MLLELYLQTVEKQLNEGVEDPAQFLLLLMHYGQLNNATDLELSRFIETYARQNPDSQYDIYDFEQWGSMIEAAPERRDTDSFNRKFNNERVMRQAIKRNPFTRSTLSQRDRLNLLTGSLALACLGRACFTPVSWTDRSIVRSVENYLETKAGQLILDECMKDLQGITVTDQDEPIYHHMYTLAFMAGFEAAMADMEASTPYSQNPDLTALNQEREELELWLEENGIIERMKEDMCHYADVFSEPTFRQLLQALNPQLTSSQLEEQMDDLYELLDLSELYLDEEDLDNEDEDGD